MTDSGKIPRKPQSIWRLLICAVAPVVLVFGVLALVPDGQTRDEGRLRGPEFHAVSTVESAEVWSGLLHHLEYMEFQPDVAAGQPPEPVSGAGEEERRTRYRRIFPDIGQLWVDADLSANDIRIVVGWEASTRTGSPRLSDREAARTALGIDEYFRTRMETNLVPPEERDGRTQDLTKKIKRAR
ncbi:MAG: hypothetical protein EOP88_10280 [Verrucomicrobiaceae bacterium]|nr:MAG: hypothetical protein EOP88_10280 [Verrucomicrobiaceae bacterium]